MLAVTPSFVPATGVLSISVDSSDADTTAYVRLSGTSIQVASDAAFTTPYAVAAANVSTITVTGAVGGFEGVEVTEGLLAVTRFDASGLESVAFGAMAVVGGNVTASNSDGALAVNGLRSENNIELSSSVAGVTLNGLVVSDRLVLSASGDIDQAVGSEINTSVLVAAINAGSTSGNVVLANAANSVAAFEAVNPLAGGVVSITTDSSLVVGTSASRGISVANDGSIVIVAGGAVSQFVGSELSGGKLSVSVATGDITLTEAVNNIASFSGASVAPSSKVRFTTIGNLVIGIGASGITSSNGLIELTANGSVTQAAGTAIVGDSLYVSANGAVIDFSNTGNAVDIFEAVNGQSGGSVTYSNSLPLVIGDRGIQAADGAITVTADGAITVRGPLEYAAGSLTIADLSSTPGSVTFVVTTDTDSGAGSLRNRLDNVQDNQAASQSQSVVFDDAVSSIVLSTPLASISRPVTIDGEGRLVEINGSLIAPSPSNGLVFADGAQGSRVASLSIGGFTEAGVRIETASVAVVSSAIGVAADGISRPNGVGVLVSGLDAQAAVIGEATLGNRISGNTTDGVRFEAGASGTLLGNTIGLGIDGTAMPNGGSGVSLDGAGGVVIGGASIDDRNVISGNAGVGILVAGDSAGAVIEGNWIGLSADGASGVGNGDAGIRVTGANANARVGGTTAGAGNVISGNSGNGIEIAGNSSANEILANVIGLDASGAAAVANAKAGVAVLDGAGSTTVGRAGYGNVISGNAEEGVYVAPTAQSTVIMGNTIGLDVDGILPVGNGKNGVFVDAASGTTVSTNIVSGNEGDGIGVSGAGADRTTISGNIVGLNAAGDAAVGNVGVGIAVVDASAILIGGGASDERNVVSGNGSHGIVVTSTLADGAARARVASNYVGTDAGGSVAIGNAGDGVRIEGIGAASATIVGNVVAANAGAGIRVTGDASNAVISANTVGLDAAAVSALGNEGDGVRLEGGSGHLVGGTTTDANVVSGNLGSGIVASATDSVTIVRNIVGTNAAGATGLGNSSDGIVVDNAVSTTVRQNLTSGNGGSGVSVIGEGSDATVIVGNLIGTTSNGIAALPNSQDGVSVSGAGGTTIGGVSAADRNVISGNVQRGISVASANATEIVGNVIGVSSNGYSALGNAGGGIAVEVSAGTTIHGGNVVAFNGSEASGHGILISSSAGTVVGSQAAGLAGGNAVYGNRGDGIRVADGSIGTVVVGNAVGTTASGLFGLGNTGAGISVINANGSVIGGLRPSSPTRPVLGNLVVGNSGSGVVISDANPVSGGIDDGNRIVGNTIRRNLGDGVLVERSGLQTIGGVSTLHANEILQNGGDGVRIDNSGGGAGGHVVSGNAIGTDVSGSQKLGNAGDGVSIRESLANSISGGNVIANNRAGIVLVGIAPASADEGNVVAGNTITANVGDGVRLEASDLNTIGSTGDLPGNAITSNGGAGVSIAGGSSQNRVAGNFIGTDAGNVVLSNARQGVLITSAEQNEVLGNAIAWNRLGGVRVVGGGGNVIGGVDADANTIRSNGGAGVVLAGGTVGNYVGGNMVRGNAAGGIAVSASSDNRIDDGNVVVKNQKFGISVSGGAGNSIDANFVGTNAAQTAQLGNLGPGIMVNGGVGTRVGVTSANVVRFNGGDGIQLTNVGAATADEASSVSQNIVSSNTGNGIAVTGGSLVAITDNIVGGSGAGLGNSRSGIVVAGRAAGTAISGNTVVANATHGIELVAAVDTAIGGADAANSISGNRSDGIHLASGTRGTVIAANTISGNQGDGIEINASIGNRVEGTTIIGNGAAGVAVVSAKASSTADGNVISGATIGSNAVGVSVLGSVGTSVVNQNSITGSTGAGILVAAKSSQTLIEANNVTGSRGAGVEINASRSTAMRGNVVSGGVASGVLLSQASGGSAADGNVIEANEIFGNAANGITLVASSFNTIGSSGQGNSVHGNKGHGIALRQGSNANSVSGNAVGLDTAAAVDGNAGDGVRISGSFSNVVGGNDISSNTGAGLTVLDSFAATSATGNRLEGNTIVDNSGAGVVLNGGTHTVGGAAGLGNTITGNRGHGVAITAPSGVTKIAGATVAGNTIQSNGGSGVSLTGATGTLVSGNSIGDHAAAGIALVGGTANRIVSNTIGGTFGANTVGVSLSAGAAQSVIAGNTISANEGDGIAISGARSTDNLVGSRSVGTGEAGVANQVFANLGAGIRVSQGVRNQVAGNSIYRNVGGGIVLQDGGNSMQAAPTLTSAKRVVVAGRPQLQVTGEVRGAPRQRIVIDLYRNDVADGNPATGLGYQARAAIGRATVTLDATGRGTFTTTLSANVPVGDRITAVATTASGVVGNASQQSAVAIFA